MKAAAEHNAMSQITRQSFINTISNGSASGIDLDSLTPATQAALQRAGITTGSLAELAGTDGRISGQDELSRLFDLIDRVDRNGSRNSIATTARLDSGRLATTLSGGAAEALQNEIEGARINRHVRGPTADQLTPSHERAVSSLEAAGFTDIHLAKGTPYYNQTRGPWAAYPYPKSGTAEDSTRTLRDAGCAPCALAMADATLRKSGATPREVADFAVEGGFSGSPTRFGSDTRGLAKAWAATHDLSYTLAASRDSGENVDAILRGLQADGVALAGVGPGHFTDKSHVVLINGYAKDKDGQEWFFVANPGQENQARRMGLGVDETVQQDVSLDASVGRVRISRAQLEAELNYACILERRV
jgi:Peptidase_C39 like family